MHSCGSVILPQCFWFKKSCLNEEQWYFARLNARKRAGKEDWKMENKSEEEVAELGDESPKFMYTI